MRIRCVLLMTFLSSVLFPTAAGAWNETGHMTVALIAYRQLSDTQKQKVAEILKAHPHYKLRLNAEVPEGVNADEWAFLKAATWPDFVRPSRPGSPEEFYKGPEITRFHQGPWHFVEYPYVPEKERKTIDPTTLPARKEPNVITALALNAKALAAADAKTEDRAVALAWIEHLVGDIHQPLHACTFYSAQYPTGDKGGNDVAIRDGGGPPMKLHHYWDDALGTSWAYGAPDFLATDIAETYPRARLPELAKDTSYESWADESHTYAIAFAHLNGSLKSAAMSLVDSKQIPPEQVPSLPPSYAGNARDVSKRRVAAAGYRLAEEIRKALGD